jgi:acid phosphatase family membrane protein YuiD
MVAKYAAMVAGLSTAVGLQEGWMSPSFAMAIIFSSIVMYDAAGVRRAAGKQARILNQMLSSGKFDGHKLQELLGHTPFEVIVGAIYGVMLTILMYGWLVR